ncbi:MAG: DUF1028 domain-containing protein [Acidobacteria bacterium]|nr:MAG: DUF1028 domain-containing protein [Acidobacteriota bacterium]
MRTLWTLVALFGLGIAPAFSQIDATREDHVMGSLGIAAYDPETGEVGVACASRVFAVGYVMAHVRAGVGAVATMGGAPYKDGPLMLDWMEDGATPEEVLERLRQRYDHIGQMSIVDAKGRSVAATENPNLSDWNGQRIGKNYAASGNILTGPGVVAGFGDSFESTAGSGLPLAERLMRALEAATRAGGDARGQMGAVLQVYKPGAGYRSTGLHVDLRVDDSPHAVNELRDHYERWKVERAQQYGSRMIQQTRGNDVARLQNWLVELGYAKSGDSELFDASGKPRGIFNNATAAAVVAFKRDHDLGEGKSANRETVIKMISLLRDRSRGRGASSFWKVADASFEPDPHRISSLSIAGYDPETGEVGIAMASRFFAVAPIAVHVRADVGAVATMGGSPYKDANEMLDWLEEGETPEGVIERLRDRYGDQWGGGQINIVDVQGRSISATGTESMWKGQRFGKNYATSGNILAGPEVVDGFADTFERTEGSGMPLAERLLKALAAADRAGGDARGRMGATLVVKKKRPGGLGPQNTDDYVNLRIDNSTRAIHELENLYYRWRSIRNQEPGFRVMGQSRGEDVKWLQRSLVEFGYLSPDDRAAFGEDGNARGILNATTADALARYKNDRNLGGAPSAGLEVVNAMRRERLGLLPHVSSPEDTEGMIIYQRNGGDVPR